METKPAASWTSTGVFAELLREGVDGVEGLLRSLQATDDLDELHDRYRVEEVHADDLVRTLGLRGELCDGDGAGVGGEDRVGWEDAVEVAEDLRFDGELFGRGFDGQVAAAEGFKVEGGGDSGSGGCGFLFGEFRFGCLAGEIFLDGGEAAVEEWLLEVVEDDIEAGAGADVGDAVAHRTGAQDSNGFDLWHSVFQTTSQCSSLESRL